MRHAFVGLIVCWLAVCQPQGKYFWKTPWRRESGIDRIMTGYIYPRTHAHKHTYSVPFVITAIIAKLSLDFAPTCVALSTETEKT